MKLRRDISAEFVSSSCCKGGGTSPHFAAINPPAITKQDGSLGYKVASKETFISKSIIESPD
jgi:hypothetical protein